MSVLALDGVLRDYAWGSHTAIPQLLGVPSPGPVAELWFGDHPGDPARVPALGTTLDRVVADDPRAVLGDAVVDTYGPKLPFLLKILAADKPLSIQVHPSRAQAEAGFAAGDPNYTDPNHKPELICALTPFEALCGFRQPTAALWPGCMLMAKSSARSSMAKRSSFRFASAKRMGLPTWGTFTPLGCGTWRNRPRARTCGSSKTSATSLMGPQGTPARSSASISASRRQPAKRSRSNADSSAMCRTRWALVA